MVGLDTNILARYYIEDAADAESVSQRELARRIIEAGKPLMVCKTVLLEFEWIMRGYYEFERDAAPVVIDSCELRRPRCCGTCDGLLLGGAGFCRCLAPRLLSNL
jgi:predicted nucleic-acid-binding protein